MNQSAKRTYGKALAIVLAVSMLLTGPMGILEAHAEDRTPPAVESIDSGIQGGSGSSGTSGDRQSPNTATPSDMPPGTSSVQNSGAPIQAAAIIARFKNTGEMAGTAKCRQVLSTPAANAVIDINPM